MEKNVEGIIHSIQEELTCPISGDLFDDPYILEESGICFSKKQIDNWLLKKKVCPITKIKLNSCKMLKVHNLNNVIVELKKLFPQIDEIKNSDLEKERRLEKILEEIKFSEHQMITNTGDILDENFEEIEKSNLSIINLKQELIIKDNEIRSKEELILSLKKNNYSNVNILNNKIKNLEKELQEKNEKLEEILNNSNLNNIIEKQNDEIVELKNLLVQQNDKLKANEVEKDSLKNEINLMKSMNEIELISTKTSYENEINKLKENNKNLNEKLRNSSSKLKDELKIMKESNNDSNLQCFTVLNALNSLTKKMEDLLVKKSEEQQNKCDLIINDLEEIVDIKNELKEDISIDKSKNNVSYCNINNISLI